MTRFWQLWHGFVCWVLWHDHGGANGFQMNCKRCGESIRDHSL